ncbi:hypothetical protein QF037_009220 [Streptomyces canus]|nr:hypothetical protein [Streptomyces canus]
MSRTFGCVRLVYNKALEERTRARYGEQRRVSYVQSSAALTAWKKTEELAFLAEVSSVPLQQALRHLQTAFGNFFSFLDSSPAVGNASRAARASSRARSASLNTTRAHPNALASALRWTMSGYSLKAYRSCMTITTHTWVMADMRKIRTGRHCTFVMWLRREQPSWRFAPRVGRAHRPAPPKRMRRRSAPLSSDSLHPRPEGRTTANEAR